MLKNLSKKLILKQTPATTFGEVTYPKGGTFGPRIQLDFQLFLLLRGTCTIRIGEDQISLTQGQSILLRPAKEEYFQFSKSAESIHRWVAIAPQRVAKTLISRFPHQSSPTTRSPHLEAILRTGLATTSDDITARDYLDQLGQCALEAYCLDLSPAHRSNSSPRPNSLQRLEEILPNHLHRPLTLSDLAALAHVSSSHLSKLFRDHYGISPMRHLWLTRTDYGAKLLRETGLTVSEIAWQCGFQTPFHFSRWIRQQYGNSPRAYRRTAWGGESSKIQENHSAVRNQLSHPNEN